MSLIHKLCGCSQSGRERHFPYTKPKKIREDTFLTRKISLMFNGSTVLVLVSERSNPLQVAPPTTYGVSGVCNDYVPNESIYNRFLYVVGYLARQGFYILIDNHANSDPTVINNPAVSVAIQQPINNRLFAGLNFPQILLLP